MPNRSAASHSRRFDRRCAEIAGFDLPPTLAISIKVQADIINFCSRTLSIQEQQQPNRVSPTTRRASIAARPPGWLKVCHVV
ncbi:MAG: hypothetical protein V5B30_05970 [Candidatus Accumulibacter delftensis]